MPRVVEVELNPVTKKLVVRMEDGKGGHRVARSHERGPSGRNRHGFVEISLTGAQGGYGGHGWV